MLYKKENDEINSETDFCRSLRVPEEKQMMFLPGILEEEEETGSKGAPTPRTSSASLSNPNESSGQR